MFRRILVLALIGSALAATPAMASINLGVLGGLSFTTGDAYNNVKTSTLLGGEVTLGVLDMLEVGAFYERTFLNFKVTETIAGVTSTSGNLNFYGAVGRLKLPITGFFADLKLGWDKNSVGNSSSDAAFGFGIGAGYKFDLKVISLSPRVDYRVLPDSFGGTSVSGGAFDLTLLFQLSL
jgi:hypothetical protein